MRNTPLDPGHYKHSSVECWDFAGAMGFLLGSATKYLYRAGYKDDAAQDIGKARTFIEREMNQRLMGEGTYTQPSERATKAFEQWFAEEDGSLRSEIVLALWRSNQADISGIRDWSLGDTLWACRDLAEELIP